MIKINFYASFTQILNNDKNQLLCILSKSKNKPNILMIVCDQLNQHAIGAYGSKYGATENIDKIAENGVVFSNSYNTCPLCTPSRASFWTGRFPHETKVLSNGSKCPHPKVSKDIPTIGETFKNAGYKTAHFGKCHDQGALRGFKKSISMAKKVEKVEPWLIRNDTFCDRDTTKKVVKFLKKKHNKPFFAVADLNNPHDICGFVGDNAGPHKDRPITTELPELPDNFEIEDLEKRPIPIQYICCSHRRLMQAAHWNEENYRHYIAAYYHYVSRVDKEIGLILETLDKRSDKDNTLIVLMADHGDGMAEHRMVTKQVSLYDSATRVPFMFSGSLVGEKNKMVKESVVSSLDLFPTLCDMAGISKPDGLRGYSLVPWFNGNKPEETHEFVVTEWFSEWCFTVSPGRMVRSPKFKYTRYLEGNGEELFDLEKDPGEKKTLIDDPAYKDVLEEHRKMLDTHIEKTDDPFFTYKVKVDPKWRSHPLGYQNHVGSCAPSEDGNK